MPVLELAGSPEVAGNPRPVDGTVVVGSGAQATWRIAGRDLAARHFTLRTGAGDAAVAPASSQNVVAVNGRQVPPGGTPVRQGDVIAAGSARFVFLAEPGGASAALAAAAPETGYLVDRVRRVAHELGGHVTQIGREVGCGIVLRDAAVSRFHADVRTEAGGHVLYSMGSSGSAVNDAPVTSPRMLCEGDTVQMGGTSFVYTRGTLPSGVRVAPYQTRAPDLTSRRATVVHQQAVASGRVPPVRTGRRAIVALAVIAAALVLLAVMLPR